jgi:predicted P-loop ATPase
VLFGTANDTKFLLDASGNRRFWPVLGVSFDIEALQRDVNQLWAEAATAEAAGESIRLAKELWPVAERMQVEALVEDPWYDVLHGALHDLEGKIRGADIWNILGVEGGRRGQNDNDRMGKAMKQLGWVRPENTIRFRAGTARGCVKGEGKDEIFVNITTDEDDRRKRFVTVQIGYPPNVKERRSFADGVEISINEKNF